MVQPADTIQEDNQSQQIKDLRQNLQDYAIVPPLKLTDEQYHFITSRKEKIALCLTYREKYLEESGIDKAIFGSYWGGEGIDCLMAKLLNGEREAYNRLRYVWNFSGYPILNYCNAETFPVIDPIFQRYKKLAEASPKSFKITAPPVCGEAGWKVDNGVVNMDVAISQERLLYVYHTGVHDYLAQKACPTILEIGAGSGMFAYGLYNSFPRCRYIICDIPESLLLQFNYLNLGMPHKKHYVASPKGLYEILGPDQEDKKVEYKNIKDGIIYIPNYMMHQYEKIIKPDLAYNAMSLHEMQPAQINYYTKMLHRILTIREFAIINAFWSMLEKNQGIWGSLWRKIIYQPPSNAILSRKRKLASPFIKTIFSLCKLLGYQHGKHGIFFEVNAHRGELNNINYPYLTSTFFHKKSFDFYDLSLCPTVWTNDINLMKSIIEKHNQYQQKYDLDSLYKIDMPYQIPDTSPDTLLTMMDEYLGDFLGFNFTEWVHKNQFYFANHLDGYRRRFAHLA